MTELMLNGAKSDKPKLNQNQNQIPIKTKSDPPKPVFVTYIHESTAKFYI